MLDDEYDMSDNEDDAEKSLLKAKEEPQMQLPVAVFVSKSVSYQRNNNQLLYALIVEILSSFSSCMSSVYLNNYVKIKTRL